MAGISEDILKEDTMESMEPENIFIDIFVQCDKENEGQVEVSTLIKFIAPFIGSNDEHLYELKKILDPLDMNPIISYDLFSNAMKIWTAKFNNQLQTSFASTEKLVTKKRLSDYELRQSTPTKECSERGSSRSDFDCELNISNISSYSYAGSVQSACDPVFLNEQINELQHQNKKLTDLLSDVRRQLTVSEEVNTNLQNENDKLKRNRQTDQKLIEDLQKIRAEFEKEREENSLLIKNHNSITQSLNFYKKESSQLRKKILDSEIQIQKNQEIITSLRHRENAQSVKIENYKHEIQMKMNEILSLQEKIDEVNIICSEKDSVIKEITEELQNLKSDNTSLQKCLDDITNKNTSVKSDLAKSGKFSSPSYHHLFKNKKSRSSTPHSFSPYSKRLLNYDSFIFNSPKTLRMLSSPVSPIRNISPTLDTDSSKSTVIEQRFSPKNKFPSEFVYICPKPKPHKRPFFSEADALNLTSSSIESETNPEKRASSSLGPKITFDDDCFQSNPNPYRSPSPQGHESLHAELIRASSADCFGSFCEHKSKLIQYEEDNENLNYQIKQYTKEIDNMKENISEINNVNIKLQNEISILTENQKWQEQEKVERYEQIQKDNEEMFTLNSKLKSDIASIKTENKRYSRLEQKINKLENQIFDEKSKSENISMQKKNIEQEKLNIEKQLLEKSNESRNLSLENKELKTINNELFMNIQNLEHIKSQLEENLLKEKNIAKELSSKIKDLEHANQVMVENLVKEENNSKELQINIKELFSKIGDLEQTKQQLQEKLSKEQNNSEGLVLKLNQLISKNESLLQTKLELEDKLIKEENNSKELKTKLNELTTNIKKIEKGQYNLKEQHSTDENEMKDLKLKLNALSFNNEILEQNKYQLEEKLIKEENCMKELKIKMNEMSSNLEIQEQTNHHLEGQLSKEENKLKNVSELLNEMTIKNKELKLQNEENLSKNKKMVLNIQNLERKIQNFRKSNTDLKTAKNELENSLRVISIQRDTLLSHVNFTKLQIKECTDMLGKNTLLVTREWQSDLQAIMQELPVSDLTDETSLSGIMRISEGNLVEDLKYLKNQTRLTGILLKSLAKIKQSEILADDSELSAVLCSETPPHVTQSTFFTNTQSFSLYLSTISDSSSLISSMSPDITETEMTDEDNRFSCVDLTDPEVSVSSPAESVFIPETRVSDNGDAQPKENGNGLGVLEEIDGETENKIQKAPLKQYRSMSEGATVPPLLTGDGDITLFPNLQDNVLESLGLQNGEQSRERSNERLTEEEIEAKFQTLALIFAIDAKTLAQRRELQRRQRNQADDNFAAEVTRLEHGIQRLAPLCQDSETKEMLTALLTRLNIIVKAVQRISISTQVYGGVQQEYRVAAAVNLMLVHLRNIQQQRDTARRQLLCTKRMLQENTTSAAETSTAVSTVVSRRLSTTVNGRVVTRRRASIATIPRPLDSPSASGPAGIAAATKRAARRISADAYSEQSVRPWDSRHRPEWIPLERNVPPRLSRPSRIELGLDLSKIHEGSVESTTNNNEESDSDINAYETPTAILPSPNLFLEQQSIIRDPETFSDHAIQVLTSLARFIAYCWNRWMKNGTTREMILFAVILFFAFGSIIILNIMIVSKFLRQGTVIQRIPWGWLTWDEFWGLLFDVRNTGQRPY